MYFKSTFDLELATQIPIMQCNVISVLIKLSLFFFFFPPELHHTLRQMSHVRAAIHLQGKRKVVTKMG